MADLKTVSIVDYLKSVGQASDYTSRTKLAQQYNIEGYVGSAEQNTRLLGLLREGAVAPTPTPTPTPIEPTPTPIPTPTPTPELAPTTTPTTTQPKVGDPIPGTNLKYEEADLVNLGITPTITPTPTPTPTIPTIAPTPTPTPTPIPTTPTFSKDSTI